MENFEDLLKHLGIGRWHYIIVFFACLRMLLNTGQYLGGSYIHPRVNYSCQVPPHAFINTSDQCTYQLYNNVSHQLEAQACQRWNFDNSTWTSTINSEFDLACETQYVGASFTAIYMMANGIGGVINGLFCDIYGRKKMFSVGATLLCINIFVPWLPDITSVIICKALGGLGAGVMGDTVTMLCMESLVSRHRPYTSVAIGLCWVFGTVILGGLGYLIRDWRTLYMVLSLPYILFIPGMWLLDESPRWLITMGKKKEALKILSKVARMHGKPFPPENDLQKVFEGTKKEEKDEAGMTLKKLLKLVKSLLGRFYLLIRTPMMRRITVVGSYNFLAMALVYFGLSLSAVQYSNDPFLYMVFSGLMDLPANILPAPMNLRFGRRNSSTFFFTLTGILLLPLPFVTKEQMWLKSALALSGKACCTIAWACFSLLVTELSPTETRVLSLSVTTLAANFAFVLAAYIQDIIGSLAEWAPSALFSLCSLVAALATLALPDSSNKPMPNTIAELEECYGGHRPRKTELIVPNDDDSNPNEDLLDGKA